MILKELVEIIHIILIEQTKLIGLLPIIEVCKKTYRKFWRKKLTENFSRPKFSNKWRRAWLSAIFDVQTTYYSVCRRHPRLLINTQVLSPVYHHLGLLFSRILLSVVIKMSNIPREKHLFWHLSSKIMKIVTRSSSRMHSDGKKNF